MAEHDCTPHNADQNGNDVESCDGEMSKAASEATVKVVMNGSGEARDEDGGVAGGGDQEDSAGEGDDGSAVGCGPCIERNGGGSEAGKGDDESAPRNLENKAGEGEDGRPTPRGEGEEGRPTPRGEGEDGRPTPRGEGEDGRPTPRGEGHLKSPLPGQTLLHTHSSNVSESALLSPPCAPKLLRPNANGSYGRVSPLQSPTPPSSNGTPSSAAPDGPKLSDSRGGRSPREYDEDEREKYLLQQLILIRQGGPSKHTLREIEQEISNRNQAWADRHSSSSRHRKEHLPAVSAQPPSPTSPQKMEELVQEYPKGTKVIVSQLRNEKKLNGCRAVVVDHKMGPDGPQAVVDFGGEWGRRALRRCHLAPAPKELTAEEQLIASLCIPKTESLYTEGSQMQVGESTYIFHGDRWILHGKKPTDLEYVWKAKHDKKTDRPFFVSQDESHRKLWKLPDVVGEATAKERLATKASTRERRLDRFRESNALTLRRDVKATPVTFIDPKTDNTLTLAATTSAAGGMSYTVNGKRRPDVHKVVYNEKSSLLLFPDIGKGCNLPTDNLPALLADLYALANAAGASHNIPRPGPKPVSFPLRDGTLTISHGKGQVAITAEKDEQKLSQGVVYDPRDHSIQDITSGTKWRLAPVADKELVARLRHLEDLLSKAGVRSNMAKAIKSLTQSSLWIPPAVRKGLKLLIVLGYRQPNLKLSRELLRSVALYSGVPVNTDLKVFVVLWGYGMIESRHVRVPRRRLATPADVHKILTEDKRWLEARNESSTWDTKAVYWVGDGRGPASGFRQKRINPTLPLVEQGYEEGKGCALHIVSTGSRDILADFQRTSSTANSPPAERKGKRSDDCCVM